MSAFNHIRRTPYNVGTVDINIVSTSLNKQENKEETVIIGLNESQRNNVIADYFNDILYNRKVVGSIFVTRSHEVFSQDDCLLHMLLNFAGKKEDVAYNLFDKKFEAVKGSDKLESHLITAFDLFSTRYFFNELDNWTQIGVTEEDIDIAGDIAGRFQQTLIRSISNQDMDETEFKTNFMK